MYNMLGFLKTPELINLEKEFLQEVIVLEF